MSVRKEKFPRKKSRNPNDGHALLAKTLYTHHGKERKSDVSVIGVQRPSPRRLRFQSWTRSRNRAALPFTADPVLNFSPISLPSRPPDTYPGREGRPGTLPGTAAVEFTLTDQLAELRLDYLTSGNSLLGPKRCTTLAFASNACGPRASFLT